MGQPAGVTYKGSSAGKRPTRRDALKTPLPIIQGHYVISLNDIPWPTGPRQLQQRQQPDSQSQRQQDRFDQLKQFTMLQPKNRSMAQPGVRAIRPGSA